MNLFIVFFFFLFCVHILDARFTRVGRVRIYLKTFFTVRRTEITSCFLAGNPDNPISISFEGEVNKFLNDKLTISNRVWISFSSCHELINKARSSTQTKDY